MYSTSKLSALSYTIFPRPYIIQSGHKDQIHLLVALILLSIRYLNHFKPFKLINHLTLILSTGTDTCLFSLCLRHANKQANLYMFREQWLFIKVYRFANAHFKIRVKSIPHKKSYFVPEGSQKNSCQSSY